ncbi:DUF1846 domain-containing protein [Nanchangia anserum]|uniref:DUF1846 domain-containing protein n=1 Tax=Nanchangia anserum TaxID=2692125 RepID=A0A8I0KUD3_9ACTO|nr:DUF1846 domain-containing protein [Nanchangia anserum]MBD3689573.1 DUF1846 domain-containing protein [Nanchangia anserum]QOX82663.1 DUF1846 domain-containing protein [Nanchangia anserum]
MTGFDREKYLSLQSDHIEARRREIGGKLYLEMGGKLFDDLHASRVLPGFTPDTKIAMLERLRDELEIVVVVNARDLTRNKIRADLGISYADDALRLIDAFRERGFVVNNVVLTRFAEHNEQAVEFMQRMQRLGLSVAKHRTIPGYPSHTELIVSEEGFGLNDYVHTTRDLVVVTAPGPGSGKLATCLSQIYHEFARGGSAGYAKFETFPIWNLDLSHPVNLAYEAATADLDDVNMIDPFHLAAYGKQTVNYNRDVEVFPLLRALLEKLVGECPYASPTDMGVNMAGLCISDDEACREAAKAEIIRRYFHAIVEERKRESDPDQSQRIAIIMKTLGISPTDRPVVPVAVELAEQTGQPASAIELPDGRIERGKTSELLGCSAAMLLNALKVLAGIDPHVNLLSPESIAPIQTLKTEHLGSRNPRLHTDEVLIALSVSAGSDPHARAALDHLRDLRGCDVHTTTILGSVDETIFRNLGIQVTSEPHYQRKTLYRK